MIITYGEVSIKDSISKELSISKYKIHIITWYGEEFTFYINLNIDDDVKN